MPITPSDPFFWRHYECEIILLCVRWYLSFPLSYRQMATIMAERGLSIHASCIWRWVQIYGPELEKRCRPHLKPTNKSYRVDETYSALLSALYVSSILQDPPTGRAYRLQRFSNSGR